MSEGLMEKAAMKLETLGAAGSGPMGAGIAKIGGGQGLAAVFERA